MNVLLVDVYLTHYRYRLRQATPEGYSYFNMCRAAIRPIHIVCYFCALYNDRHAGIAIAHSLTLCASPKVVYRPDEEGGGGKGQVAVSSPNWA